MRRAILFPTVLLFLFLALGLLPSCGGGGSSSDGSTSNGGTPPGDALPAKILSWQPPSAYADGTTLNPTTDLADFEIYVNETGHFSDSDSPTAVVAAVDSATGDPVTSFNLANLGPFLAVGVQYEVSMRAVSTTGAKSNFCPPGSFSF